MTDYYSDNKNSFSSFLCFPHSFSLFFLEFDMVSEQTSMESEIPSSSSPLPDNPPNTDNQPFQFSISPSIFTNPASPFYLPHGESPGTILVSQPLIGKNYNTWSRSMIMVLTAKNKLAFVDGSLPQPSVNAGAEYQAWI